MPGCWPAVGIAPDFAVDYRLFYYLTLGVLLAVIWLLSNLERSRWGRACVAVREDELAAACMGIRIMKVKLSAFALSAALAGLAGSLYATTLGSTAGPDAFDFARSIMILAAIILGGLGSLRGTLLGVFLLVGFDNVLTPLVDGLVQGWTAGAGESPNYLADLQQLEVDDFWPGVDPHDAISARGFVALGSRAARTAHRDEASSRKSQPETGLYPDGTSGTEKTDRSFRRPDGRQRRSTANWTSTRSFRSSVPTVPARRPRSTPSPAFTSQRAARSSSTAAN